MIRHIKKIISNEFTKRSFAFSASFSPDDFLKSIFPLAPLQQIAVLIDHLVQRSVRALGHSLGKLTDRVNLHRILRQRGDVAVLVIDLGRFPVPQYDDSQRSGLARIHETDEYQRIGRIVQPHQFVIVIRSIQFRLKLVPCVGTRHP